MIRARQGSAEISRLSWAQEGGFTTKNPKNSDKPGKYKLNVGEGSELTPATA